MPGPERAPSEVILEVFDERGYEPHTTPEVADETGYPPQTVRPELRDLVEQNVLRTKDVGDERVWWPSDRDEVEDTEPDLTLTDAPADEETEPSRQWLLKKHSRLARFVTQLNVSDDLDELLRHITEEARSLVGAHQSVTSRTVNQDWGQAINAVSLSEKYAEYSDYSNEPDGSGIYALVCERNEPIRMTQSELESHPAWNAFGDDEDEHPPMRGWLAVPIIGSEGQNMGLIQVSDKYRGEFTEADEVLLVQLANVASAAIENARLYDDLRESEERYRTLFDSMTEGYCVVEAADTAPDEPTDFRYVEANPAFRRYAGVQDVVGTTVREQAFGIPDEWINVFEDIVQTGTRGAFQRVLELSERVLQCHAFTIEGTTNRQVGMTVQDITERVEHERKLEASNQRLESFASMLAHELRNPVTIGQIYSQQLPEETDAEATEYVTEAFDRIENMIDVMLVVTQGQAAIGESEGISLGPAAREAWESLNTPEATLQVETDIQIETDETYIHHLFQNLFENAIQHGRNDATVRVGKMEDGFFVADDGGGIPAAERERVFEMGVTTAADNGGTGLGLAFVRELASVYDWSLRVTESAAGGARFEFADVNFVAQRS
ncbi:GAF domain-containing sensor histidine kinase [Haloarcula amylovorans]|uniref:GAF domain-containing sensor histidine kinase n=1 Tax=Haloarcula amylovorans TaxID=2562280 RepID=UPI001075F508|nr:ATP-binding protein [Halomicroarcula amylolytica]